MQAAWVQSLGLEDPWRKKWQPTPVFLPRKSHGRRSLVAYSSNGCNSQIQLSSKTTTTTKHFMLFEPRPIKLLKPTSFKKKKKLAKYNEPI